MIVLGTLVAGLMVLCGYLAWLNQQEQQRHAQERADLQYKIMALSGKPVVLPGELTPKPVEYMTDRAMAMMDTNYVEDDLDGN